MAMHQAEAVESAGRPEISLFARRRKVLSDARLTEPSRTEAFGPDAAPTGMATDLARPTELSFLARIRKFVWLSSGMFSAASLTMAAVGIFAFGSIDPAGMGTSFLAGIATAGLFGLTSILRFGPDEA